MVTVTAELDVEATAVERGVITEGLVLVAAEVAELAGVTEELVLVTVETEQ